MNKEIGYLHRFEDVQWVEGIVPLVHQANRMGYVVVIVTNQSGIARGYYTEEQFHELMRQIRRALEDQDAHIHAVYYSPFHPEHGIGAYRKDTDCRKPGPGMLVRAAADHGLDLASSIMVGDRCSDMAAGMAGGLIHLFLLKGTELNPCGGVAYKEINSLDEVTSWILQLPATTGNGKDASY